MCVGVIEGWSAQEAIGTDAPRRQPGGGHFYVLLLTHQLRNILGDLLGIGAGQRQPCLLVDHLDYKFTQLLMVEFNLYLDRHYGVGKPGSVGRLGSVGRVGNCGNAPSCVFT